MKSSSEHSIDEDYASLYHLKDMLEEVKLLHLHPTAAFGGDSGNDIPDFVVYQVKIGDFVVSVFAIVVKFSICGVVLPLYRTWCTAGEL